MYKYILDARGEPVAVQDPLEWARWFETADWTVAKTDLGDFGLVSTVFLSLDRNWAGRGKPVLWQTMVFGGPMDEYQERYRTRKEAVLGHRRVVASLMREKEEAERRREAEEEARRLPVPTARRIVDLG